MKKFKYISVVFLIFIYSCSSVKSRLIPTNNKGGYKIMLLQNNKEINKSIFDFAQLCENEFNKQSEKANVILKEREELKARLGISDDVLNGPANAGDGDKNDPAGLTEDQKKAQQEAALAALKEFESFSFEDWSGASWPPSLVHRDLWEKVNGYSEEFSPGFYSDPDFSMKLWNIGVRVFKGVAASRVYHFQSKSLARIVKNDGRKQFYEKWGITASFFDKYFIKKGQKFQSKLESPSSYKIFLNKLKVKFYRLLK